MKHLNQSFFYHIDQKAGTDGIAHFFVFECHNLFLYWLLIELLLQDHA